MVGDEQHRATHAGDARCAFDDLQSGSQCVARGAECAADLAVSLATLDDETAEIKRIFHQFACLLNSHAFFLAQLGQQLGIFLATWIIFRIDERGLADVGELPFGGLTVDDFGIADEYDVGQFVGDGAVGGPQGALFFCFGQNNAHAL